ncbi:MAG: hypothetical protein ACKN81_07510 [Pirellulaceae bacterium]
MNGEPEWRFQEEVESTPASMPGDRLQSLSVLLVAALASLSWLGALIAFWGVVNTRDRIQAAALLVLAVSLAIVLSALARSLWQGRGVPRWILKLFAVLGAVGLIFFATHARAPGDFLMLAVFLAAILVVLRYLWRSTDDGAKKQ